MPFQEISYGGWSRNLCLANDCVELVISLEVGPRILSYRPLSGSNVLHNFPSHMGGAGETEWMNRGGHRLWVAPEHSLLTYLPDNEPYPYELTGDNTVSLITPGHTRWPIRKDLTVELAASGSDVRLFHTITNETDAPQTVAVWALSVMAPGGTALLPQPPLGQHPQDLLPNRNLVLWPYCDATDNRFHLGRHFVSLRQDKDLPAFKFGLAHQGKWAAYLLGNQLFTKTVTYLEGASYLDLGCNFESFTNEDMLEIETLGPQVTLAPGESSTHVENWQIFGDLIPPPYTDTQEFADWLRSYLPQ